MKSATTPDERLYPEYDELLDRAVREETECFFRELIKHNLGVRHFIDSDFTFVNRPLAQHYDLPAVLGQEFNASACRERVPRWTIDTGQHPQGDG